MSNLDDYLTRDASDVLDGAQTEAKKLGHNYIGTEHLLLSLLHDRDVYTVLHGLGVPRSAVYWFVRDAIDTDAHMRRSPDGLLEWNWRARRVLEDLVPREVEQAGHNFIAPAHLLLAIIRDGDGVAARVLASLGVSLARARQEVRSSKAVRR